MVKVVFGDTFKKYFSRLKSPALKGKIAKQIGKLESHPTLGKPMRYGRKGTRELYIKPYRLSYIYEKDSDTIILLELYHKDEQ
ncbi:MAG: type II toxin-antitoxin system RelE/ParE family toxin [Candidatus Woesearchaeota archaeon]